MKDEEIRKLIDSFFNGESTEEEEKLLRAFFSGNDCPESFEAEREYIRYCLEKTEIKSPSEGFSKKILEVTVSTGNKVNALKRPGRLIYLLSAVAASVIIFLSVYIFKAIFRYSSLKWHLTSFKADFLFISGTLLGSFMSPG